MPALLNGCDIVVETLILDSTSAELLNSGEFRHARKGCQCHHQIQILFP